MTLVSQIITDAFRQSNLIAINTTPTTAAAEEALRHLNRIVVSVLGNEVGDPFTAVLIGDNNIEKPFGYPYWQDVFPFPDFVIPVNIRLVFNLSNSIEPIHLTPRPEDGSRFSIVDPSNNLSQYPVTLKGNGFLIDGATEIVFNEDGMRGDWLFRADLGSWMKSLPLVDTDTFPFPEEFEEFFITSLAMRINPMYGQEMSSQAERILMRAERQLRARYHQTINVPAELGLLTPSVTSIDRDYWLSVYGIDGSTFTFNKGWPF